jgi:hypothetical protein
LVFSNDIADVEQTAICAAFLNLSGKTINKFGRKVKIRVEKEDLAQNVFAVGSSFYAVSLRCDKGQIVNNSVWKKLNTNTKYVAEEYDGYLKLNKKTPTADWFTYNVNDPNTPTTKVDLFTVALHEGMHILGMHSLAFDNGNPNPSYSTWDRYLFLPAANVNDNIIKPTNAPCCQFGPNSNITFPVKDNCKLIVEGNPSITVNTEFQTDFAHSISHLCSTNKLMALNYIAKGGARKMLSSDEEKILCKLGYESATAACTKNNCIVQAVDDYFTIPSSQTSLTVDITDLLGNDVKVNNNIVVRNSSNQVLAINQNKVTLTGFNVFAKTLFNYTITSCDGICSEGIIYVYKTMAMPPCPTNCNLVCNGNFDAFTKGDGTSLSSIEQFFSNMLVDDSNTPDYFTGYDIHKRVIKAENHCNNKFKFNDPANLNLVDYQVVSEPYSATNGFMHIIGRPIASSHEAFYLPLRKNLKVGKKYKIDFDAFSSCPGSLRFAFSEKPPCPYPIRHKDVFLNPATTGLPTIDCQNGDYFYPPQMRDFVISHNPNVWTHHNDMFVAENASMYLIICNTSNNILHNSTFLDNISVLSEEDNPILIDNTPVSLCIGSVAKVKIKFCNPTDEAIVINAETTLDVSQGYTYATGDFTTTNINGKATLSLTIPPNNSCVEKTLNFNIPSTVTSGMTTTISVNLFGDNANCLKNKSYQFALLFNDKAPTTADFTANAVAPCPAMQLVADDQTSGSSHTWTIKQAGSTVVTTLGTTPTLDLTNLLPNTSYDVMHIISNQCGSLLLTKTIQSPACPAILDCTCDNDIHRIGKVGLEQKLSETNFFTQHPLAFDEPTCMTIAGRLIIDVPYTFQNVEMIMQPGSEIIVNIPNSNATNSLNIIHCHLHSCSRMWRGIRVQARNYIYTDEETKIEDAEFGIKLGNKTEGRIRKTTFNKDYIGIDISAISGTTTANSVGVIIDENTFQCDDDLLPRYDNVNLGTRTYAGIQVVRQSALIGLGFQSGFFNTFTGIRNGILIENSIVDVFGSVINGLIPALPQTLAVSPYPSRTRVDNVGIWAKGSRLLLDGSSIAGLDRGVLLNTNANYTQDRTDIESEITGVTNFRSIGNFRVETKGVFISTYFGVRNYNSPNRNFFVGKTGSRLVNEHNVFMNSSVIPANNGIDASSIKIEAYGYTLNDKVKKEIIENSFDISTDYNGVHILRDGFYRVKGNIIWYDYQ